MPTRITFFVSAIAVFVSAAAAGAQQTPRAAVARIVVQERDGNAFGSGALVDARGEYGLVVTNWHVVRDATGPIEVLFPSGFRSEARSLKLDQDWDLAALVIWRPPAEPMPLATAAPRPGERLTICGYGSGKYREATGRCTEYYAPELGMPHELVELSVEARQGDSGGPILNERGQIAGVLFGAGQGTTLGSFGGRVGNFLASLAPGINTPSEPTPAMIAVAPPAPQPAQQTAAQPAYEPTIPAWRNDLLADSTSPFAAEMTAAPTAEPESPSAIETPAPASEFAAAPVTAPVAAMTPDATAPVAVPGWFDEAKTIFAVVGIVFVLLQLIRLVT